MPITTDSLLSILESIQLWITETNKRIDIMSERIDLINDTLSQRGQNDESE